MKLGAHESIAQGLYRSLERGKEDGCEVIQIFTQNQNRWVGKPITTSDVDLFLQTKGKVGIEHVISHNSYLINLCATDADKLEMSRGAFAREMRRCHVLQIPRLVFHPGSHLDRGEKWGVTMVAKSLDHCIESAPDCTDVTLCLETTAGQGSNLGYRFEHLRDVMAASKYPERLAVCVDTAHLFAAGYDIREEEGYEQTWEEFSELIGLEKLVGFHLNDSKKALGTRVDRHEHIGDGHIGLDTFRRLLNDERFVGLFGILETPSLEDKSPSYKKNLNTLRALTSS